MSGRPSATARLNAVVDHIDAHLAGPLDLHTLACLAHYSPWHFHRLFQAATGEALGERVRRRRLEVAAVRLLATPPVTALAIALDVGFGSAEAFTRAFRQHFGVTPGAWRRGACEAWMAERRAQLRKIHQAQRKPDQALEALFRDDAPTWPMSGHDTDDKGIAMKIDLKTLPEIRVAYLRHTGPYGDPAIGRMWGRFAAWCTSRGLKDGRHASFGISRDSPEVTAADQLRYDACIEVDAGFTPDGDIGVQTIAPGLYACTRFSGTPDAIHAAWVALFNGWLADSAYQSDDRLCLEAYGTAPEVDAATGAFACDLCVPVRPR
jgi:AraC family transcriptional regulator